MTSSVTLASVSLSSIQLYDHGFWELSFSSTLLSWPLETLVHIGFSEDEVELCIYSITLAFGKALDIYTYLGFWEGGVELWFWEGGARKPKLAGEHSRYVYRHRGKPSFSRISRQNDSFCALADFQFVVGVLDFLFFIFVCIFDSILS